MRKNLKLMGVACASLLLLGGCGEIATLSDGSQAVVTFEGLDGISADTLYTNLKNKYGIEALLSIIDKEIYENEFPNELDNATEQAESYVSYYISMYGSEDDFLAALNGSFTSIEEYKEYLYISYFQNIAIEQYSESLISDNQIEKYYDEEYYSDVELAHILITSSVSSTADADEVTEAETAAENQAKEILELLNTAKKNGDDIEEYFATLAEEYSNDSSTNTNGGNLGKINYMDLSYAYDEFIDMAITLNDGEYSTSVVETELGFHIILKISTDDKKDLSDVSSDIKTTLSNNALAVDYSIIYDSTVYYRDKNGFEITDSELLDDYKEYMNNYEEYLSNYFNN